MPSGDSHASAFSHYVGVTGLDYRSSYGWLSHIVHNLMARYLGDEAPESPETGAQRTCRILCICGMTRKSKRACCTAVISCCRCSGVTGASTPASIYNTVQMIGSTGPGIHLR